MTNIFNKKKSILFQRIAFCFATLVLTASCSPPKGDLSKLPTNDYADAEPQVGQKLQRLIAKVKENPGDAAAWGMLGMNLHVHGFPDDAIASFSEAYELDGEEFRWPYYAAFVALEKGDASAFDWLLKARKVRENYAPLHVRIGEFLLKEQRFDLARSAFERAQRYDSRLSQAEHGLAKVAEAKGETRLAIDHAKNALRLNPRHHEAAALLRSLYRQAGDEQKSAQFGGGSAPGTPVKMVEPLIGAMMLEGVSRYWYVLRGKDYLAAGKYVKAISELELARGIKDGAEVNNDLGYCFLQLGKIDDATRYFAKAVEMAPNNAVYLGDYGNALAKIGDPRGEKLMRKALDLVPGDPAVVSLASQFYREKNRWLETVDVYRRAHRADSDSYLFQYNLAWFLAVSPDADARNPKEALAVIEAMQKNTDLSHRDILELFSVVYAANKDFPKALRYSQQAIARAAKTKNARLVQTLRRRHELFEKRVAWTLGMR